MNRHFLLLGVLSLSSLAGPLACSGALPAPEFAEDAGSATPPVPASDGGATATADATSSTPPPSTGDDSGPTTTPAPDAGPDAASDAALPAATGTLLAPGSRMDLAGITDDGFVAYQWRGVRAVPLAGGPAFLVQPSRVRVQLEVSGAALFMWSPPLVVGVAPALGAWTKAHGTVFLDTTPSTNGPVAASPDGTKAAFFSGKAPAVLTVMNLDGKNPVPLGNSCATALAFDPKGDLISTNCAAIFEDGGLVSDGSAPPDGAVLSGNVSAFAAPTYAQTLLAADATYAIDPTGAWLRIVDNDGTGKLVRASDGSVAFHEASVSGAGVFDPAGSTVFYVAGGALKSVPVLGPAVARTIAPGGVTGIRAVAPDGQSLVFAMGTDVAYQSLVPGAPAARLLTSSASPTVGYTFTSDSSDIVLVSPTSTGSDYEVLEAATGTPVLRGSNAQSVSVLAGTKVLVVDTSSEGRVLDVSKKEQTVLVPQMGAFAVSKDRSKIAYVAEGVAVPGLYVLSTSAGTH